LIEAQYKDLGAVWLGVYPREERVRGLKELLKISLKRGICLNIYLIRKK